MEKAHVIPVIIIGVISSFTAISLLSLSIAFPVISYKIFEQFIQLNATIIGFTIVGIIYYMGRTNDMRRDQIGMLKELVDKFNQDEDRDTFAEQFKQTVTTHKQLFEKVMHVIHFYTVTIVAHYAVAITLCFVALLSNELNRSNFVLLVIVAELILSTVYFYASFWRELKAVEQSIHTNIENYIRELPNFDRKSKREP